MLHFARNDEPNPGSGIRNRSERMTRFITYAIEHARLTLALLVFLLVAGLVAYRTIPKEAEPDVKVPIIYTQLSQRGISPEDAERLRVVPEASIKELADTGFFRMLQPKRYDGLEADPIDFFTAVRDIAGACSI